MEATKQHALIYVSMNFNVTQKEKTFENKCS